MIRVEYKLTQRPNTNLRNTVFCMQVSCMFCLQRYWSLAELKQHVSEHHTRPVSPVPVTKEDPAHLPDALPKTDIKEERKEETEGSG